MKICIECKINKAAPKRKICYRCKSKKYRENNPLKYSYNNLKGHAKSRNKQFTLTFKEFKEFCVKTEYLNLKGRTKTGYHIDRIDETKGYTKDNIQLLTNSDNVKKYVQWIGLNENNKSIFKFKNDIKKYNNNFDDCLF